ncbi:DeoR/GlpR family DNA-binding transcription regulator [Alicyclobacillus sp. SO9]|uniref:DeoR/GlpR family DNA-binding transcription regulator n=1 Tax=Alicyclobacillus sp. SO9 TaxID=2665646 RepID=UPI0018E8EFAC|nr:DeoR/GlpR family DNA-binding transcription regulator [Alicyclobacillus sp. SO9]QQE77970.1 DeoR/GlpR transcriptional regulator [Alicyclobacillus sp. SO9]
MMALERQRKIVELVNDTGSVKVTDLSRLFHVTPETARRDLDLLATQGKLCRSHGGAIRMETESQDIPYTERESMNSQQKMEVAEKAASYVEAGDIIALDASSSAWYLARALPEVELTVITNSIPVIQELGKNNRIQAICTGGILRVTSMSFVGPLVEEALSKYHVNKTFVSCKGIDVTAGISESNELQAVIKRKMVSIADKTYLLADHTKFGVRSLVHTFNLSDIDIVVSDSEVSPEIIDVLLQSGIRVE